MCFKCEKDHVRFRLLNLGICGMVVLICIGCNQYVLLFFEINERVSLVI